MELDQNRQKILIELFPEAVSDGKLDVSRFCRALGLDSPAKAQNPWDRETIHSVRNAIGVVQSGTRVLQRRLTEDAEALPILESIMAASVALKQHVDKVTGS